MSADLHTETSDRGGAVYDAPMGTYRYLLWRHLHPPFLRMDSPRRMTFILLNPSTATHVEDDPTIRRCIRYAQRERMDVLEIVNLFAFRSPYPKYLRQADDPAGGVSNDEAIFASVARSDLTICGWGSHGAYRNRDRQVAELLAGRPLLCLGQNVDGSPVHPLYQPKDAPLAPWEPR